MAATFYWHDYETWGADPRRDRPCQFAGLRTDADFNPVGAPLVLYCRPALDLLPQPEACLITGITPQLADAKGLIEAEFTAAIAQELSVPGTCGVGYNSFRFDDEVTRHIFYRNLLDPYAREWQNGNSRWDLIDILRLAQALRPEGIVWPLREDGSASFRLEDLTAANAIPHAGAHDALADVQATIALARLLRRAQPRLYDYALRLRDKREVRAMLEKGEPLVHASARFPAALGCIAPIVAVAPHPSNGNGVICFDLRAEPDLLLDLSVEELRRRLFTPSAQLPDGVERIPLKTVQVNHAPVLAPLKTLTGVAAARWSIDPAEVLRRAQTVRDKAAAIRERVQAVHQPAPDGANAQTVSDPDLMLYSGGFLSDADRRTLERVRRLPPADLATANPRFADARLPEMLFRYRARNWPEVLSPEEREEWDAWRLTRLTDPQGGGSIQLEQYEAQLEALSETQAAVPAKRQLIKDLAAWAERLMDAAD